MGGHPWFYFVPYQTDILKAVQELKEREFRAGRYNPAMPFIEFPIDPNLNYPGAQHRTIKHALKASLESGTRSILDIERLSSKPGSQAVCPIDEGELRALYGTPSQRELKLKRIWTSLTISSGVRVFM